MVKLITEAIVVGISSAIVGFLISTLIMLSNKDFKLSEYKFWPQVVLSFFMTGVILHFMYEYFGGNAWYCKNGSACLNIK